MLRADLVGSQVGLVDRPALHFRLDDPLDFEGPPLCLESLLENGGMDSLAS